MSAIVQRTQVEPRTVFDRVLVGVDSSEESREAVKQAAALAQGPLSLLAAYAIKADFAAGTPMGAPAYYSEDRQREAASDALARVREELGSPNTNGKVARGIGWDALVHEARREHATLIAVGSHGVGRMAGIALGSTATNVIHKAPCSVLVARKGSEAFPRKIVVGIDGSPESVAAYEVAKQLAERFETTLVSVVANGGEAVDLELIDSLVGYYRENLPDEPVRALVAASADADLLVVGSRGRHGLKALGSVSERVAHEARASVLIVRDSASPDSSEQPGE